MKVRIAFAVATCASTASTSQRWRTSSNLNVNVLAFVQQIARAARDTNEYMVSDGRSSQHHEYTRVGNTSPNQSVESLHGNAPVGERQQRAHDPARTVPGQPDDMYVEIGNGPARAVIPKKDYAGEDWAGLNKEETNAALRARIQIAISGLTALADGLLPVPGLDESRLTRFWANIAREAYDKGKW